MKALPYPVFTVAPCSLSRKRRLLDLLIPALAQRGLRPALITADRLLGGEADLGPYRPLFSRWDAEEGDLPVYERARKSDIVFCFAAAERSRENAAWPVLEVTGFLHDFEKEFAALLGCAERIVAKRPVGGWVLIGGRSSRMGRPKHLLAAADGSTWLERSVSLLARLTDGVVLSGQGEVPAALSGLVRLADIPDIEGPLAGMTAALRWQPDAAWLVAACDMPGVTEESISWLLTNRRLGSWGTVPRTAGNGRLEPLFALYEPQAGPLFESMHLRGDYRLSNVTMTSDKIAVIDIPAHILRAWENVNTPGELEKYWGSS